LWSLAATVFPQQEVRLRVACELGGWPSRHRLHRVYSTQRRLTPTVGRSSRRRRRQRLRWAPLPGLSGLSRDGLRGRGGNHVRIPARDGTFVRFWTQISHKTATSRRKPHKTATSARILAMKTAQKR